MRGFLRVLGRFFKILGRRERTKEEQKCKLHMLDPYVPLFSNMFEMLDFGILVRFSWMFPDVLYTCSHILP